MCVIMVGCLQNFHICEVICVEKCLLGGVMQTGNGPRRTLYSLFSMFTENGEPQLRIKKEAYYLKENIYETKNEHNE